MTLRWPLNPHMLMSHVRLYPRIIVSNSHSNTSKKSMWIQWLFFKNLIKRSMIPRWPLTPLLLRSHVWLYPRIIVCKSHENMSKVCGYSDYFSKTSPKGKWPQDDLWPHFCWGHMPDSTIGSLYPNPMKIRQSMWIQWPFWTENKALCLKTQYTGPCKIQTHNLLVMKHKNYLLATVLPA